MITLLTGKTGSGKSYYSVECILKSLETGKTVFTNIKLSVQFENYIYMDELAIKKFLEYIDETFSEVDNLEDKKEEVKQTQYFDADFYIDEAHLVGFRGKKDAVLNWLTIHRHFDQNIIVITQVPTNVHKDYFQLFHSHIDMIPPNKRISKNSMGLREYEAYKGDRLRTTYFTPKSEIFEIYNSGNVEKGINKDIFRLILVFFGLIFLGIFLYNMSDNFLNNNALNKLTKQQQALEGFSDFPLTNNSSSSKSSSSYSKYILFTCIDTCKNTTYKINFRKDDLSLIIDETKSKIINTKKYNNYSLVTVFATPILLKLFQGADHDKKKNHNTNRNTKDI